MSGFSHIARLELVLLCSVACQSAQPNRRDTRAAATSASPLQRLLAPRASSRFVCEGPVCRQSYPRLPSAGEWRCAEHGHVVWCAGGEPAAGVVPGPAEAGFRCGQRWGKGKSERVCIDLSPEYPDEADVTRCSFEQERGIVRVCKREGAEPAAAVPLPAGVIAACWLDRDCASGRCDRGACGCAADAECQTGRCREQRCVEAQP